MPRGNEVNTIRQEHVQKVIEQAETDGYDLDKFVLAAENSEDRIKHLVNAIAELSKKIPDSDKNGMTLAVPTNRAELIAWVDEYRDQSGAVKNKTRAASRSRTRLSRRSQGRPSRVSSRSNPDSVRDQKTGRLIDPFIYEESVGLDPTDGTPVLRKISQEEFKTIKAEEKALDARDAALARFNLTPEQRRKVDENFRIRKTEKEVPSRKGGVIKVPKTMYESMLYGLDGQWQDMGTKSLYDQRLGEYVADLKAATPAAQPAPQNLAQRLANLFGG